MKLTLERNSTLGTYPSSTRFAETISAIFRFLRSADQAQFLILQCAYVLNFTSCVAPKSGLPLYFILFSLKNLVFYANIFKKNCTKTTHYVSCTYKIHFKISRSFIFPMFHSWFCRNSCCQ